MSAIWLILVPILAGVLCYPAERLDRNGPRWLALGALAIDLGIVAGLWLSAGGRAPWLDEVNLSWVPRLGISLHLGVDGLSLILTALTLVVGVAAVVASWQEVQQRVGFFHLAVLCSLAGVVGVFLALDLFLFYCFWELMLLPTYLLFFWGRERRLRAAVKFFIFTQLSGLLMLLAIVGLYLVHGRATGAYTFDYPVLLAAQPGGELGLWLFLGFWIAFAVKLPVVPFHTWLPDAYAQAPTAGTIILAGAMAKTAGYGLIRFAIPLFPAAAAQAAPYLMTLSAVSIIYGAWTARGQNDFKRLVAYSSVSAMGFVMLGAFAGNDLALQGATMQMVAHGLSTGGLFFIAGALLQRLGGTSLGRMGGLWTVAPRLGGLTLAFALATLGLPGLGNFVGEFLVLLGSFRALPWVAGVAALGLVLATVYALWLIQRVFFGPLLLGRRLPDLSRREAALLGLLLVGLLWLGLLPQQTLDLVTPALSALPRQAQAAKPPLPLGEGGGEGPLPPSAIEGALTLTLSQRERGQDGLSQRERGQDGLPQRETGPPHAPAEPTYSAELLGPGGGR